MCTCKGVCTCKTTMQELMRGLRFGVGSHKLSDTTNEGENMTETVIKTGDRVRIEHFMGTKEGTYRGTAPVPQGANRVVDVEIAGDQFTVASRLYLLQSAEEIAAEKAKEERETAIKEIKALIYRQNDEHFNLGTYWQRDDHAQVANTQAKTEGLRKQINKKLEELL